MNEEGGRLALHNNCNNANPLYNNKSGNEKDGRKLKAECEMKSKAFAISLPLTPYTLYTL